MRRTLALHPDSRCNAVAGVDVDVMRPSPGHLVLRYTLTGTIKDVRLPAVAPSTRADELWRHTCFETFTRAPHDATYCEFNFAPSTQWAAYGFSGYRSGMRVASDVDAPFIEVQLSHDMYTLQASLDLDRMPHLSKDSAWQLGLSAV